MLNFLPYILGAVALPLLLAGLWPLLGALNWLVVALTGLALVSGVRAVVRSRAGCLAFLVQLPAGLFNVIVLKIALWRLMIGGGLL
jgi:hypothetical protein